MKWFWQVRLYRADGYYWTCEIETGQTLDEIVTIQRFYEAFTGQKLVLEGMSAQSTGRSLREAFDWLRGIKITRMEPLP